MNKVSKVVHNLIPESFIPGRIQRLNTLMNILPTDKKQSMTANELINQHVSALGLSEHTQATALRILRRDLSDLQNEGQIQNVSCRPKRFFKSPHTNPSVAANAYGGSAANDDNASATLCSLSLSRRIISKADKLKSIKPINVSTNVVGIIVKSTGIFVVKATL